MKYSNQKSPEIKIYVESSDFELTVRFINNTLISDEVASWMNDQSSKEPEEIATKSRFGLRVVKLWINLSNLSIDMVPVKEKGLTITKLIIPKEIIFERRN